MIAANMEVQQRIQAHEAAAQLSLMALATQGDAKKINAQIKKLSRQ